MYMQSKNITSMISMLLEIFYFILLSFKILIKELNQCRVVYRRD